MFNSGGRTCPLIFCVRTNYVHSWTLLITSAGGRLFFLAVATEWLQWEVGVGLWNTCRGVMDKVFLVCSSEEVPFRIPWNGAISSMQVVCVCQEQISCQFTTVRQQQGDSGLNSLTDVWNGPEDGTQTFLDYWKWKKPDNNSNNKVSYTATTKVKSHKRYSIMVYH